MLIRVRQRREKVRGRKGKEKREVKARRKTKKEKRQSPREDYS